MSPREWGIRIGHLWPKVKEALQKASKEYKLYADRKRMDHKPFQVGDQVYVSTKYIKLKIPSRKLDPKYLGPFTITKVINPVTVELKLPPLLGKVHPVFHSSLLKPVDSVRDPLEHPGPLVGDQYEIVDILDSKLSRGRLKYLVQWKGYPLEEASWVPVENLKVNRLWKLYHRKYPHKPGGGRKTDD